VLRGNSVLRGNFASRGEFRVDGGISCRRNSVDTQLYILLKKTLKSVFTINICVFCFFQKCFSGLADFLDL
jgi:hypothetical protein